MNGLTFTINIISLQTTSGAVNEKTKSTKERKTNTKNLKRKTINSSVTLLCYLKVPSLL